VDARIRKEAQRMRVSEGEWVRRAIEHAIATQTKRPAGSLDPLSRLASLDDPTAGSTPSLTLSAWS
jgi:hypothetical protein